MEEGTKERILRIALELFAQNGYLGTSMNDIAGQLGFTKAALYKCAQKSTLFFTLISFIKVTIRYLHYSYRMVTCQE